MAMKHIHTFESFLNEAKLPNPLLDKAAADLAYSMPNHSKPEEDGTFSDETIEKAIKKYSPFLAQHIKSGMKNQVIDRVKEICNESFLSKASHISEGVMSEIDVIRQESKTLEEFIKNVDKEYPGMKNQKDFLTDFWNNGK